MRTWSLLPAVKSSRQHRRSLSSCSNQLVAQKELGEKLPVSDDYLFPPSLSKLYRHFCKTISSLPHGELPCNGEPLAGTVRHISATEVEGERHIVASEIGIIRYYKVS